MKSKSKQRHVVTSCGDTSSFWSFDFLAGLLKLLKPAHSHSPTHPTKLEKSIRKKLLKLKFPPREAEKTHLRRPMLLEFFGGSGGTEGGVWSWESRMALWLRSNWLLCEGGNSHGSDSPLRFSQVPAGAAPAPTTAPVRRLRDTEIS